jgi:hypothetical protein
MELMLMGCFLVIVIKYKYLLKSFVCRVGKIAGMRPETGENGSMR